VELCKLAIWHSLQYTDVDTNLIGIQTTEQLYMNLDVLRNGITEKEKALLQEIQEKQVISSITFQRFQLIFNCDNIFLNLGFYQK